MKRVVIGQSPPGSDPAFPANELPCSAVVEQFFGLTKREMFAAMAMQGLLSNLEAIRRQGFQDREIEEFALMRADALIAALEGAK